MKSLEVPVQGSKVQQVRCGSCVLVTNMSQVGTGLLEGSSGIRRPIRKSTRQLAEKAVYEQRNLEIVLINYLSQIKQA